jgi:hypothetical protein
MYYENRKIKNNIFEMQKIYYYCNKKSMSFTKTIKNVFFKKKKKKRTVRKTKLNKFHKMNCSPAITNEKKINNESCFTPDIFMTIIQKYNEKHPNAKIIEKNPKKAWKILKKRLSCKKEECWLNQLDDESMKEQIKKYVFAPKHPEEWNDNPDEWLSNFDIFEVAKQYEVSYPEFKIIGPTTIDFDTKLQEQGGKCVLEDLCNFSLDRFIKAKKTKIGIVFNLDKHYQSGSHWVSLFIDIENKYIFFFDSANNGIPPEIWMEEKQTHTHTTLVNRIIKQGLELENPIHFTFYNNKGITHQRGNTECGMYSLFFIITQLTCKTPFTKGKILSVNERRDLFLKSKIPDNVVFQYRKLYFND